MLDKMEEKMRQLNLNMESSLFLQKGETEKVKHSLKLSKAKKILVSSTLQGEGKTTIALNVCAALAEDGDHVLYIGGSSKLIDVNENEMGKVLDSGISNFDIIINNNLGKSLDYLEAERYNYIFIEAPAIEDSKEGIFLADSSDSILFVVETNRAGYKQLKDARKLLTEGKCKDLRVVLNRIKKDYRLLKRRKVRRD